MKKIIFFVVFILLILVCFAVISEESIRFSLRFINIPFPPYHRNVIKLIETSNGNVYGVISETPYSKGKIFLLKENETIIAQEKFLDDILQVDSIIFNPELSWTWDKTLKKIIVLDNSGTLKIFEKNDSGKEIMRIAGTRPYEKEGYQISRSFAFDKEGNIYTAGKDGFLFKLDSEDLKIEKLKARLPAVKGREPWASLDAATLADDGTIYLGTYDGYIAQFNPQTQTIINLGKPLRQQRIQTLIFYRKFVFGIGGEPDGLPRWFIYDPETRSFEPGGTLKDEKNKLVYEPVNTMIVTKNGEIIGSVSGRLGSLFKIKFEKIQ